MKSVLYWGNSGIRKTLNTAPTIFSPFELTQTEIDPYEDIRQLSVGKAGVAKHGRNN